MGNLGTGVPVLSNFVQITSPGKNSNYIWVASPGSPYFVPIDLSTGTIGNQIKMPYSPNSMVLDPTGTTLYFGSYHEMMTYTASTNSLASEVTGVPGIVLAVSPTNSAVLINDQLRGVIYLYTPSNGSYTSFAGIGQKAAFTADGQTVYVVGDGVLYIHNSFTGWSVETLPRQPGNTVVGHLPRDQYHQPPFRPTQRPTRPTPRLTRTTLTNKFCSPRSRGNHSRCRSLSFRNCDVGVRGVPRDHGQAGGELSRSGLGRRRLGSRGVHHRRPAHHWRVRQSSCADGIFRSSYRSMPAPRTQTRRPQASCSILRL